MLSLISTGAPKFMKLGGAVPVPFSISLLLDISDIHFASEATDLTLGDCELYN